MSGTRGAYRALKHAEKDLRERIKEFSTAAEECQAATSGAAALAEEVERRRGEPAHQDELLAVHTEVTQALTHHSYWASRPGRQTEHLAAWEAKIRMAEILTHREPHMRRGTQSPPLVATLIESLSGGGAV